ncbi:MAG: glycosyltransferase family 4 protein [Rhodospirillales bacterium]
MSSDADLIMPEDALERRVDPPFGEAPRPAAVLQVLPAIHMGGGVERGTIEIAEAVASAGGRAIVASSGGNLMHELERVGGEHVTLPLDSKNPLRIRANIAQLTELIKEKNIDIVHARSRAPAWSAMFAARRAKKPFITTFHGVYNKKGPLKRLYNSVMARGDKVIAISGFVAGHVRRHYGVSNERLRMIPRGVDVEKFNAPGVTQPRMIALAEQWRLDEGFPVIALPGRLTRWKGQTVFIEAVRRLARRDVRCILIGPDQGREDYRQELETLIQRYDLGGVMRIVGECRDMPAAYMLSDIIVHASTDPEAFGRVVIEAQAMGRPVIAADHGGPRETVVEGETGWRVPQGDPYALADAMARALDMTPDERERMAARAVANARNNFSKDLMCSRTLEVYNEVLTAKDGGGA